MNPKKQNIRICHRTTFYSIFNMSSCRKPEIQNGLPKSLKSSEFCYFFKQKSVTLFISSCNNYLIEFLKIGFFFLKLATDGIRTRNPWV